MSLLLVERTFRPWRAGRPAAARAGPRRWRSRLKSGFGAFAAHAVPAKSESDEVGTDTGSGADREGSLALTRRRLLAAAFARVVFVRLWRAGRTDRLAGFCLPALFFWRIFARALDSFFFAFSKMRTCSLACSVASEAIFRACLADLRLSLS